MFRIVFLDRATLASEVKLRRPKIAHTWDEYRGTSPDEIFDRAKDADIIILNKVKLHAEMIDRLPKLKMIGIAATGYDCVDIAAAEKKRVAVANIRGYAKVTVPEHTFALILSVARSIATYKESILAGAWQKVGQFCYFDYPIMDLCGKRLGLIGSGVLGNRVAELGRAFGMDVVVNRQSKSHFDPAQVSFDEVIETADVISLHCPLNERTKGMIGLQQFRRMKRNAIIVNTARGGLIVEEDLYAALTEGLILGAGLDVTTPEPPSIDSTFMKIAKLPNAVVTPHTAWASLEAQQVLADQLIDNIDNFMAGQPSNLVTK